MRESDFVSELRAALRRRGVWGARADRLLQEWSEHVRDDAAHRIEQGAASAVAHEGAWQALGGPDSLAAFAARELARASWLGRHPWLGGLALPVLGWIGAVVAVVGIPVGVGFLVFGGAEFEDPAKIARVMQCWALAVNWLPWLLSMAWLAWIAVRMPGGWKLYWITAVVLILFAPAARMEVRLPLDGPQTGDVFLALFSGILRPISSAIEHGLFHLPYIGPRFEAWMDDWMDAHGPLKPAPAQTEAWIQTAIMGLGALTFYLRAIAARRSISAALVCGGLVVCWILWGYGGRTLIL